MKPFSCANCGKPVCMQAPGTHHRNHCPFCLFSLHIDNNPGDRANHCFGHMRPIGKMYKPDGEEMLIHQCAKCGATRKNRVAGDDSVELIAELPEIKL